MDIVAPLRCCSRKYRRLSATPSFHSERRLSLNAEYQLNDDLVERITTMRSMHAPIEYMFLSGQETWSSPRLASEIASLLEYQATTGPARTGHFADLTRANAEQIHTVIATAVRTRRFRTLQLQSSDPAYDFAPTIKQVLQNCQYLEHLTLEGFLLSADATSGLLTDDGGDMQLLESLDLVNCLLDNKAARNIAEWLARNQTLTCFRLESRNLDDEGLAAIIAGMVGHSKLKTLEIQCSLLGPLAFKELHRLLSCEACRLETLSLESGPPSSSRDLGGNHIEHLISQEKSISCKSLIGLRLKCRLSSRHANSLLQNLNRHFPNLEMLDLSGNPFVWNWQELADDLEAHSHLYLQKLCLDQTLACRILLSSSTRTTHLSDEGNSHDDQDPNLLHFAAIHRLLDAFPKLHSFGNQTNDALVGAASWNTSSNSSKLILHHMDMNRTGYSMLVEGPPQVTSHCAIANPCPTTPTGLWPLILEKVNTESKKRQSWRGPNAIYHLLQGPAFLARDALS